MLDVRVELRETPFALQNIEFLGINHSVNPEMSGGSLMRRMVLPMWRQKALRSMLQQCEINNHTVWVYAEAEVSSGRLGTTKLCMRNENQTNKLARYSCC